MALMQCRIFIAILVMSFVSHINGIEKPKNPDSKEAEKLPPCQACKTVVNSVQHGMARTNKRHFGGGDTAWEEEKLGDYAQSEVRLVEIQEKLCAEVQRGQNQCYSLAEEWEQLIEEWWFKQKELGDLHSWLCIKKVEYCCPDNHYGPECKPCEGFPDNVCNNNGQCKGSGTRKGNGDCRCNAGYSGPTCSECAEKYYESYRDEKKLLCSKCHPACKGSCSKAGHKGCNECNSGWMKDGERGCVDINECTSKDSCKTNQFCVNNDGSYSCLACDNSCEGCHGDGPDMCNKCASGYVLKDGLCIGVQTSSSDWTRYLTYLGLCIATCIIFQKNTLIASVIGLSVAVYVAVSEYMLSTLTNQNQFFQNSIDSFLKNMN
ncbi:cysteine-rich with EGF-like domain protein 2 [Cimex lectularius]|uniref:EGF-like domain-containing protein n=1 Tax=Cimex lectularius TaxID=79782 RepID=A0A8I6TEE1_CIMLE|nr:cysteine-rich with EGF-like domain protein 2 [Cimex lectularius]